MKKTLTFLLIFTAVNSFAQVSFVQVEPDPDFFEIHIPFLSLNFAPANSTFFIDMGGRIKKGKIYCEADYRISYVNSLESYFFNSDIDYNSSDPTATSIYGYKLPAEFSANFGYMVMQKDVTTKARFSGGGWYTLVEATGTRYLMAELGLKKGFDWLNCTGKKLTYERIAAPDGFKEPLPSNVITMMDYTIIRMGVSYGTMGHWKAKIKKLGKGVLNSNKFVRYNADLLILAGSKVDPIYVKQILDQNVSSKPVYTEYGLDKSKRSPVGFCIGASLNGISRLSANMGVEAAYVPGLRGDFMSHFSFQINSSISIRKIIKK